jgi:hypothetical protein
MNATDANRSGTTAAGKKPLPSLFMKDDDDDEDY